MIATAGVSPGNSAASSIAASVSLMLFVGQLLPLPLARGGDPGAVRAVGVERGLLVRVLAVAQRLGERPRKGAPARGVGADRAGHPCRHGRIIGRGPGIGRLRHPLPEGFGRCAAVRVEFGQKRGIVVHVHDGGDVGVVLRRRADHRRAADVDVLDALVVGGALRDRRLERVQVHDQQVDRLDPVFLHGCDVPRVVAQRQQAAVDRRVQRLHAAVHHFGKARQVGHVAHGQPRLPQRLRGAAGGQKLDPPARQSAREVDQAGLVGNGNQRAAKRDGAGHAGPPGRLCRPLS